MRQGLKSIALMTIITVVLFLLVEGTASTAVAAHAFVQYRDLFMATEQSHTEYDSLLGWVSRPSIYLPDLYGKGVYLRTNARTLENWEQGRAKPNAQATTLIRLVQKYPETVVHLAALA